MELKGQTLFSGALHGRRTYYIALPKGLVEGKRYPVIYLLHGYFGSELDWWHQGQAPLTAQAMMDKSELEEAIIVIPNDGGYHQGTFYLDWYDGSGNFEQYFIHDLLPHIDENYPTDPKRRVIAGLSMGGFGAFLLALRNPELFKAAASMSGVLRPFSQWNQDMCHRYVGPRQGKYAREHDLNFLVDKRFREGKLPALYFDCGRGDELLTDNLGFKDHLDKIGCSYQWQEFAGVHTWEYWRKHLRDVLLFFNQAFRA